MRSDVIVIVAPSVSRFPGLGQVAEAARIEELVAHATVEAFDVSVLRRLSRIAELQNDVMLGRPAKHRKTCQLGALIDA